MTKNHTLQGFTLIEISIVLIIAGFILVGALSAYEIYEEKQYLDNTKSQLVDVDQYIIDFPSMIDPATADPVTGLGGTEYGRLPCADADGDGVEDCGMATIRGRQPNGAINGPHVMVGSLPYATLGLPLEYAREPSKTYPLVYAVTQNATNPTTYGSSVGAIRVQEYDENDNPLSPQNTIQYIVVSLGSDVSSCGVENCDGDADFISAYYQSVAEDNFDDRVVFKKIVSSSVANIPEVIGPPRAGIDYNRTPSGGYELLVDGYLYTFDGSTPFGIGSRPIGSTRLFQKIEAGETVVRNTGEGPSFTVYNDEGGYVTLDDSRNVTDDFLFVGNPGPGYANLGSGAYHVGEGGEGGGADVYWEAGLFTERN